MTTHIIACGDSAKHWNGKGYSIGVNDAAKWGHHINRLIVVNSPTRFKDEPERMRMIMSSTPDEFYCNNASWEHAFPKWKRLDLVSFSFSGRILKHKLVCSKTSPFIAISMAYNLGATDIVIWGVDMMTHKYFNPKTKQFMSEYNNYLRLFEKMNINVWRGADGTCFDNDLKLWNG